MVASYYCLPAPEVLHFTVVPSLQYKCTLCSKMLSINSGQRINWCLLLVMNPSHGSMLNAVCIIKMA